MTDYIHTTIDVETIPGLAPGLKDYVARDVKVPGSYKKADSIAAWERDEKPAKVEEAWLKTSLDPLFGELVVIGAKNKAGARFCYIEDRLGDPSIIVASRGQEGKLVDLARVKPTEGEHPERLLLRLFFANQLGVEKVAGFNVEFDLRFLLVRAVRHRLEVPNWLPGLQPRIDAIDAMHWIGGYKRDGWSSLKDVCIGLGVEPPVGEGKEVWSLVQAGKIDEVVAHCASDIDRTDEILQLMSRLTIEPKVAAQAQTLASLGFIGNAMAADKGTLQ